MTRSLHPPPALRMPPHPSLQDYAVTVDVPVAWGEMDALGHINNAVFFRYFEIARTAYLERIGFTGSDDRFGPILAATECRFLRPLTYPDTIRVGARTARLGTDRFEMEYRILSGRLEAVAAEGSAVVVSYDYRVRRRAALPGPVADAIRELDPGARSWPSS